MKKLRTWAKTTGKTGDDFHMRFVEAREYAGYSFDVNERITTFIDILKSKPWPYLHVFKQEREEESLDLQDVSTRARMNGD